MSENNPTHPDYILGHSQRETQRLQLQARLLEPYTRRLFEAAGISTGMKVLDVGSGAGDVAILVAKMVGPGGTVIGIDKNPIVLETARQRASTAGLSNVSFVSGEIGSVTLDTDFDAVVGRLVLLYVADHSTLLRAVSHHLRPAGILAFQEFDLSLTESIMRNEVTPKLYRQMAVWLVEGFRKAGAQLQMSLVLPEAFRKADLPLPQMYLDGIIGLGQDWDVYDFIAETFRSALPLLVRFGTTTEEEADVDTFAKRLRDEVVSQRSYVVLPLMLEAWGHLPEK